MDKKDYSNLIEINEQSNLNEGESLENYEISTTPTEESTEEIEDVDETHSIEVDTDQHIDNLESISEILQNKIDHVEIKTPSILPKINKRALPKDSETYMLETFKKNIMIIFNHEFVDGYDQRKGTDNDERALRKTFSKFGFEILSYKDKTRKEVGQITVNCK